MTRRDQGSGTVLSLGFMAAIAMAGVLVLAQLQAVMTTHALAGAADLRALAAAQAHGDACARAERVAQAHRVRLVGCRAAGEDFIVRVESDLPGLVSALLGLVQVQAMPIQASARAGPAGGSAGDPGEPGD